MHCHDKAASHYLPTTATDFYLQHPSASEELRSSTCYLLSSLKEHARGQFLHDKKKKNIAMAARLHQGHTTSSLDIQNSWILSRQIMFIEQIYQHWFTQ